MGITEITLTEITCRLKVAAGAPALLAQAQALLNAIESRNHE